MEVPPLVTRPKAATVGVGRQVILRPALQKRCVTLPEPTLADQRTDVERLRDALPDLELRVDLPRDPRPGPRALRRAATTPTAVTAVVVDDVLVGVEPGDTTERRFGIAFDLGTTTVVATLLDLATGTPVAVASLLNPQQPFGADVITRISATMMDPDALDRLTALAHEGLDQLAGEVCDEGGVDRAEVYEIALAGNATMTHLALGLDPEPLGGRAVRHGVPVVRRPAGHRPRRRGAPAGPGVRVPGARRLRRRRHRRRRAGVGDGPRPADPAVHRHRHELRDPARPPATGCSPRRRPPGRPSRARPSAAACGPRRAPSRA